MDREGFIRELGSLVMEARGQQLTLERWVNWLGTNVAGAESRGAEIKLPPGDGAEITNCGSGSYL